MVQDPQTVDGWLFPEEGTLLEKYAAQVIPFRDIIELGAYKGKSTCYLARSAQAQVSVISVDTFMSDNTTKDRGDTLQEFLNNTEEYSNVLPLPSLTRHVAQIMTFNEHPAKVGLLFIDADHSYEGVKADYDNFRAFLAPGAFIIFHDAYGENQEDHGQVPWPGVNRFVHELEQQTDLRLIEKCRRCAVFQVK